MSLLAGEHVVLVLGAGATLAQAATLDPEGRRPRPPLDATFLRSLKEASFIVGPELHAYAARQTGDQLPLVQSRLGMEELFVDLFLDIDDDPDDEDLRAAYADLLEAYQRLIGETTAWLGDDRSTDGPLARMLAAAADGGARVTVVTFNHDLVVEGELQKAGALRGAWCVDHGYGSLSDGLARLEPDGAALDPEDVFPRHADAGAHEHRIAILKLHGSLNWVSSAPVAASRGEGELLLLPTRRALSDARTTGRDERLLPVLVPPVHAKAALRAPMRPAWTDADAALREADRVVVFGYSLPPADREARRLLKRALGHNARLPFLDVVNPDPASAARFAALHGRVPVRWYPGADAFLAAG